MTDFNKNMECVSALNIRRIANEIRIANSK
jgi:hypothetical protein